MPGRWTTGIGVALLALAFAAVPAEAAFKRAPIELGPSDGGAPTVVMAPDGTAHAAWGVGEDVMRYCAIPPGVRTCQAPVGLSLPSRASRPYIVRRPQDGLLAIVVGRRNIDDDPDESLWAFTSADGVAWAGPAVIAIGIGEGIDDVLLTADGQAVDVLDDDTSENDFVRAPLGGPPPATIVDLHVGSPANFPNGGDLLRMRNGRTLALLGNSDGASYRLLTGPDALADASWTPHRPLTDEDRAPVGAAGRRGAWAMYGRHLLDQIRGAPPQVIRRFRGNRWGRPRGLFYEVNANFPAHALAQDARGQLHAVIIGSADSGRRECIAYARTRKGRWFSRAVSVHQALREADRPRDAVALAVDHRGHGAVAWASAGGAARLQRLRAGRGVTRPGNPLRRGCPGFPR